MAAGKASQKKIIDVSRPSETAADSTSRPVIVSNRPMVTQDPMMAAVLSGKSEEPEKSEDEKGGVKDDTKPLTPHAEKVIKPLGTEAAETPDSKDDEPAGEVEVAAAAEAEDEPAKLSETKEDAKEESDEAEAAKPEKEEEPEPEQNTPDSIETDEETGDDKQTNPEAVKVSEEDRRRAAELEEIIASGKYNVPIDARGKRRTLIITIWLVVLTLLLAAVLVDALLDVGILNIQGIPHTHFFSLT